MILDHKTKRALHHLPTMLIMGLLGMLLLVSLPMDPAWKAFWCGFGIFTLDMGLMVKLYAEMILIPNGGSPMGKGSLTMMALLKLLLMGGGLFISILVLHLSGIFIFWGALASLVLCSFSLVVWDRRSHSVAKK